MAKFDDNDTVYLLDATLNKINEGVVLSHTTLPWGDIYEVRLSNGMTKSFSESSLYRPEDVRLPTQRETNIPKPLFMKHQFVDRADSQMGRCRGMRIVGILREPDGSFRYEVLRAETPTRKIYKEADLVPSRGCER